MMDLKKRCDFPVNAGHVLALNFKDAVVRVESSYYAGKKAVKANIPMLIVFKTKKRATLHDGFLRYDDRQVDVDTSAGNKDLEALVSQNWIKQGMNGLWKGYTWDGEYLSPRGNAVPPFSEYEKQHEALSTIYDNLPNLPQNYIGWWNLQ